MVAMGLISATLLLPLLLLWYNMSVIVKIMVGIILALHIGWIPIVHSLTIEAIRRTTIWYIIFSSLLLWPQAFLVAGGNGPTGCLYFLAIPLTCYVILPSRMVIYSAVFALLLIMAAYLPHCFFENPLSDYLKPEWFANNVIYYNKSLSSLYTMLNQIIIILHICLVLYTVHKQRKIGEMDKSSSVSMLATDKYDATYKLIVDYMEQGQPYCHVNFNISHLSIAINSSVNYVSSVIKNKTGMHVVSFINSYRVEFAKKALQKTDAKFTIEYLSQSAGFKNQTTFNRVFKATEGITPTEYMNSVEEIRIKN